MARQSITFTELNDRWLKEKVETMEYASKSELVNELIRREREYETKIKALGDALREGIESGVCESFDFDEHLRDLERAFDHENK